MSRKLRKSQQNCKWRVSAICDSFLTVLLCISSLINSIVMCGTSPIWRVETDGQFIVYMVTSTVCSGCGMPVYILRYNLDTRVQYLEMICTLPASVSSVQVGTVVLLVVSLRCWKDLLNKKNLHRDCI